MSAEREFVFELAVRSNEYLVIGIAGGTGSGKTYTAMRMAKGLAGGRRFAVIDTENRRARHYADQFQFDVTDFAAPFRPERYQTAILAAARAGYSVIVVDSMSHVWDGEDGVLDWHEEELDRMAGNDFQKREACKQAGWIKPKRSHKRMVSRLLQIRAHIILCFRAEEKTEMQRDPQTRKMKMVPRASPIGLNGWIPICEKKLPFDLTASFLLINDAPGIPNPIKLEEQHRPFFSLDQPITERAGELFGDWARGDARAETEFDRLLRDYALCDDEATLAELEKRRIEFWKQQTPAGQKPKVKEAADAARKRLDEAKASAGKSLGAAPEVIEWTAKLNACASLKDLEACWLACNDALGLLLTPEIGEVYENARERLAERAALAEDEM